MPASGSAVMQYSQPQLHMKDTHRLSELYMGSLCLLSANHGPHNRHEFLSEQQRRGRMKHTNNQPFPAKHILPLCCNGIEHGPTWATLGARAWPALTVCSGPWALRGAGGAGLPLLCRGCAVVVWCRGPGPASMQAMVMLHLKLIQVHALSRVRC